MAIHMESMVLQRINRFFCCELELLKMNQPLAGAPVSDAVVVVVVVVKRIPLGLTYSLFCGIEFVSEFVVVVDDVD